ncbi:unnamed protein product [Rodentolepis nana]|uniref:AAA domain-containing protein n=1 Tax=Rodentolepis nana TaxID=102285 RepID=A0A158QI44_RODNA|nr:unnamed protein product [Rodentolepis nana]
MSQIVCESDEYHLKHARKHLIDLDSPEEGPSTSQPPKRRKTIPVIPTSPTLKRSERFLHNRIPSSGDYVPITFSDGRRRYLSVESGSNSTGISVTLKQHKRLLPEDLCNLINEAEQLGKSQRTMDSAEGLNFSTQIESQLWVKKYEPACYLDLISAEHVNRKLLSWLKAWDLSVFGVESKVVQSRAWQSGDATNEGDQKPKQQHYQQRSEEEIMIAQMDPKDGRRPNYRIVLISGPPGLGKTTMAHLLSRHAGYQVVETNARCKSSWVPDRPVSGKSPEKLDYQRISPLSESVVFAPSYSSDDRTPSAMRERLEAVVSSQASLNANVGGDAGSGAALKPSCLIIDEVDGALPAAVEVLAEAAATPLIQERKRSKKKALVLKRPVICICNDLYAPSIRPLRAPGASCYILRLPPIDSNRLVERLDQIARLEDIVVDKQFLSILAETSGRDIRSCLNVLQFAKVTQIHQKRPPTMAELMAGLEGSMSKDTQYNLFSAWQAVFTIPAPHILTRRINQISNPLRSRAQLQQEHLVSDTTLSARIQITMEVCDSTGETPNLILGLFENYLNCRMKDASMQKARSASDWLVYSDCLLQHVQSQHDYTFMRYVSLLPAWFHLAFASTTRPLTESRWTSANSSSFSSAVIRWPTAYNENTVAQNRTISTLESLIENQWRSGGPSSALTTLRFLTHRQFLLDASSYVNRLLSVMSVHLRPVNTQLYNVQEREHLLHLISIMISLGLDWVPHQTSDTGEPTYRLEPPLDTVAQFSSSVNKSPDLSNLPYAIKQMMARELAMERVRRAEAANAPPVRNDEEGAGGMSAGSLRPTASKPHVTAYTDGRMNVVPTSGSFMASRLAPKAAPLMAAAEKKVRRDFFGRPIVEKEVESKKNQEPEEHCPINKTVWFKFKEGHSNAVRRPFFMKRFLKGN